MTCFRPVSVGILRKPLRPGAPRVRAEQTVPCGSCLGCRMDQARDWSIRIMHETMMHESSWFLTLTYSDERLPENGSLFPLHLRAFFKDLRRNREAGSVSYFACGEYGETTDRPHYHAVLFGPDFLDRDIFRYSGINPVWRSETLASCWPYGFSEFGTVTHESASYVAGYVRKKVLRKENPDHLSRVDPDTGELVEVYPEFSRMSLKPAIGKRWIEKFWQDVYPRDYVVVDGKEYRPPRFYDRWMDENHPDVMLDVRLKRDKEVKELSAYTLESKEKIAKARNNLFNGRNKV